MSFFRDYVNYFRWQTENHPQLLHAAVPGSHVFAVIDQESAKGDFRSSATEKGFIFRLIEPSGSAAGDADPNTRLLGGFIIARYNAPRTKGDTDQTAAMDSAWKVGVDIIVKMVADSQNGHPFWYYSINTLDALELNFQPRLLVGDVPYCGWMFTFRWRQPVELCLGAPGQPAWLDGGLTPLDGIGSMGINSNFIVT